MTNVEINIVPQILRALQTPKRLKIILGGRGSTKSTAVADYVAACVSAGQLWCCAREQLNSIDESVHRNVLDEIERIGLSGFEAQQSSIRHVSGGRIFYRGLSRNITSLKSTLTGVDGLWIEEAEGLSLNSIKTTTASVRLSAKDAEKKIAGDDVKMPEIIMTMNRGSRSDPISKELLEHVEADLERCGWYEDDFMLVCEVNYTDMPEEWFIASGLEVERQEDYKRMSRAMYDHKWHGKYYDEVEGSIIKAEWFDACIDAHKLPHLKKVFEPLGARVASFDPNDGGADDAAYALRHGAIIETVKTLKGMEINDCCDWATGEAIKDNADWFTWDGDGMGAGLKGQIAKSFEGKKIQTEMFKGSLSGSAQDNAEATYKPLYRDTEDYKDENPKKYKETFLNNRSQRYTTLAQRCYNTWLCVEQGEYMSPDVMISFNSEGIENMNQLRSQMCKIPEKPNSRGLIQIMSKQEMASMTPAIPSPNDADAVMMSLFAPKTVTVSQSINFTGWG